MTTSRLKSGFAAHRLQEGVHSALAGVRELTLKISGIYDEAPAEAVPPYITFGTTNAEAFDTSDAPGSRVRFDVTVWSDDNSQMQAKELMAEVDDILHQGELEIEGFDLYSLFLQNSVLTRQVRDTGNIYRGVMTYRALLFLAD